MSRPFYSIDDKLTAGQIALFGLQHVLAMFVGIITPPLVVAGALELPVEQTALLITTALFVSGLATLIQVHGVGPFGSRMLSVQGTSFTFVPLAIAAGKVGGLPLIFGLTICCAPMEILLSRFLGPLRRWFPPVVTGTVVILIGCSLIGVGMTDFAGGFGAKSLGSGQNLSLGLLVLTSILAIGAVGGGRWAPVSIALGLVIGYAVAGVLGMVDLGATSGSAWFKAPRPLAYGLELDLVFLLPWIVAYAVSSLETMGDLSATSSVSQEPVEGPVYMRRIQGGVAADGLGSIIAGFLGSLPTTSFSQNNGVIRLTGVASRRVGYGVGVILMVLALFPKLGAFLSIMPKPVLGGATVLMFATVAVAGFGIVSRDGMTPRKEKILAVSLALGLGVIMVPGATASLAAASNPVLRSLGVLAQSGLAMGAVTAVVLNRVLPEE